MQLVQLTVAHLVESPSNEGALLGWKRLVILSLARILPFKDRLMILVLGQRIFAWDLGFWILPFVAIFAPTAFKSML